MNINSIEQTYQRSCLEEKKTGGNSCQSGFSASLEETAADAADSCESMKESVMYVTTSSGKTSMLDKNALISMCHAATGESANVYKAEHYSESTPLYLIRGTDEDGNTYEKIVDVNTVDPANCSYLELLALSAHTGHTDFFQMSVLRDQAGNLSFQDPYNYLSAIDNRMVDLKLLKQWDSYLYYNRWVTDILNFLEPKAN